MMASSGGNHPGAVRVAWPDLSLSRLPQADGQQQPEPLLLDRWNERAAIGRRLDAVRDGFSGTLVLSGGPGSGKTMLLEYAIDAASGLRVTAVTGVQSEISLAFGAVHQLLVPFLTMLDVLPPPQRHALGVAFGLEEGPPPDRFLVGLAALTVLSRAAEEQPVLCVIDDAHWLDAESAQALGFVARRLYADRVGLIIAVGEPDVQHEFDQLPAVVLGPLPDAEAAQLLRSVAGGPLPDQVVGRILADTQRNPLALAELGADFTSEQLAAHASVPEPLPLSRRLEERFLRQARGLPGDAQMFVLLAATELSGKRPRLWRAAELAGIDPGAAAAAAESARLLEFPGVSVRFRHPLIRSAVYYGATDAERRRAHLTLAEVSSSGHDQVTRAWHRAAAATAPDEHVAAELERAAEAARGRGGYSTQAALLRRSVELTPDDGRRTRREVALADAELKSGHPDTARHLVDDAVPRLTEDVLRGQANRLTGEILFAQGKATEAADVLAAAARELEPDDRAARDTILEALRAAMWAGPAQMRNIARAARSFLRPAGSPPTVADLLLEGHGARCTLGYDQSVAPFRAAAAALLADDLDPATALQCFGLGVSAAGSLWDDQALLQITERWVRTARTLGALTDLPVALAFLALTDSRFGRFDDADAHWAETRELIAASHSPATLGIDSGGKGLLLAYRGRISEARTAGVTQVHESTARGQRRPADFGRYIVAVADLSATEYDAAVTALLAVVEDDPASTAEAALPELVEAASRSGNRETAAWAFKTLSERALAAGTPWALGLRARCQALLDDGENAENGYTESIRQLKQSRATVDLARTHLLYGQWLRRARRRRDARNQLRTAHEIFTAMGAYGFAEQAATELRATGERARARAPQTTFDLTPREACVAELAAEGSSNNDIGAQLFISPRTVDYHLGKVFRKLNVTSRSQLARRMGTAGAGQRSAAQKMVPSAPKT
jgi:DNA-binding CsgD family transcriptional regulator